MKRMLFGAVAGAAVASAFAVVQTSFGAAGVARDVRLSEGDTVRVAEAQVGCRVTRLARYGNRLFLDCRRGGRLVGTYGTYFGEEQVLVVRYVEKRKANVVLEARHERGAERCR